MVDFWVKSPFINPNNLIKLTLSEISINKEIINCLNACKHLKSLTLNHCGFINHSNNDSLSITTLSDVSITGNHHEGIEIFGLKNQSNKSI